ncbi:MAG TPA: hypothetical protein VKB88_20105 [Bryobacteraceae bacterium]|nr:hypothetical protein [Bryobacteraceae bacterium]
MISVAVEGQGIAACCCALLLQRAGSSCSRIGRYPIGRVPALVVSQSTQRLMADVFGDPALFAGLPRIERRIVAWGANAAPHTLPHSAVVIAEETLAARLPEAAQSATGADWTIFATGATPAAKRQFGTRRASVIPAEIEPVDAACWVESLLAGWLFLIPGWLIAVGGDPQTLLAQSRLVAPRIRSLGNSAVSYAACPRIADPLCGPGWLACGSSAMAFDPICGDGTGNAVREAILASAVLRAAARGEPVGPMLAHYRARLIAAFRKHLQLCLDYYRAANAGPWWESEIAAQECGVRWCEEQLAAAPTFQYRLDGFDLLPVTGS